MHRLDAYAVEAERAWRNRDRRVATTFARTSKAALDVFLTRGFPTTHEEEWRFTSVSPIADRVFTLAASPRVEERDVDRFRLPGDTVAELVFLDGRYAPGLSRESASSSPWQATNLASALTLHSDHVKSSLAKVAPFGNHAFVALNTALFIDAAYIELPENTVLQQPIHLLFLASGDQTLRTMSHPRALVLIGPNSQASIVETYAGPDDVTYFTNAVSEIVLGENAVLDHCTLQAESALACHVGMTHIVASRFAAGRLHSVSLGGALVRNEVVAVLNGEGADCLLNGLYVADRQRLVDNHTTIDHARPHCASRELYKGILAGSARGVFNGKIIVRTDAQKTDSKQTNRALLLSEDAQINTTPQLEILANDVKCTHGAAVGQFDAEALFYLRSRGLDAAEARRLLIHAFASDVVTRLPLEPVRTAVAARVQQQLADALQAA